MPEEKILFAGGGSVGPEIPMWPNLGTVRSDRNRILEEYISTVNTMIDLEPEILLPGQDEPITDKEQIMSKLTLLRDAATYVYDEIWAGLSSGKDVYELMRDIKLPEEYAELSQQHGRVEWTVRETVNQAGAWFQYKYTSELYPYRPTVVYPELVELAGGVDNVLGLAQKQLKEAFESSCEKLECEFARSRWRTGSCTFTFTHRISPKAGDQRHGEQFEINFIETVKDTEYSSCDTEQIRQVVVTILFCL